MKQNKTIKIVLLALTAAAVAAVVITGIPVLKYTLAGAAAEKELIAVRESYYHRATGDEDRVDAIVADNSQLFESADYLAQYEGLLSLNQDTVGWITIADTQVDFPVVQTEDNLYYLGRNILKRYSDRGAIFADYRNACDGTDKNLIIYGHNMYDGSMFGRLYKYKQPDYLQGHGIIDINLMGTHTQWQVFAVYITNDDPVRTSFNSGHDFKQYLRIIDKKQMYDAGVTVNEDDQILTISTCTNNEHDGRFVLHAVRIDD